MLQHQINPFDPVTFLLLLFAHTSNKSIDDKLNRLIRCAVKHKQLVLCDKCYFYWSRHNKWYIWWNVTDVLSTCNTHHSTQLLLSYRRLWRIHHYLTTLARKILSFFIKPYIFEDSMDILFLSTIWPLILSVYRIIIL